MGSADYLRSETMAVSHTQSHRRGGSLPRLWIDPSLTSYRDSMHTPASGLPSAAISGATSITDTPSSAELLHVICLYDYDAEDSDQLSFIRNEILEVVKQEETVTHIDLPNVEPR